MFKLLQTSELAIAYNMRKDALSFGENWCCENIETEHSIINGMDRIVAS